MGSGLATDMRKRQRDFFRKIDTCLVDDDSLLFEGKSARVPDASDKWRAKLYRDMESLRVLQAAASPSHTRVIEAAIYLLRCGLLNVKGTSRINIKQGRALMHWAWWLQQEMSQEWMVKGMLGKAPFDIDRAPLCHVLTGGAGAGKTTTLRVIESLLDFS